MELKEDYTYAVVGASNNPSKYGHKVLANLKNRNFHVIPINPNEKNILGLTAYASLIDCPRVIDIVIFVVPPAITNELLKEVTT